MGSRPRRMGPWIILAALLATSCLDRDGAEWSETPGDLDVMLGEAPAMGPGPAEAGVSFGGGASLDAPILFEAWGAEPGEELWSGQSTIVVGDADVEVVDARGLADDRVEVLGVKVAERGVEGLPGATLGSFPGSDSIGGSPPEAIGHVLHPGEQTVVYTRAALRPGEEVGLIYGAALTVVFQGEQRTFTVLSPTVLCVGSAVDNGRCADAAAALQLELERARG